ncbi:MAG: TonB-dependent receptor, partial [Gammaproteobacteria bacterium]
VYSLALSKAYDWGLDWTLGYAYTESSDVNPMTSSVAFSNYVNVSVSDPNDPGVARSNYNIKNRFTLVANFRRAFFGDNQTKITLYGRVNEGRPFSPVFVDGGNIFGDTLDDRHLLYIPSGPTDPKVVFAPGFDQAAFFSYLEASGLNQYAGGIAPRNSLDGAWWHKFDLKISQELPSFVDGHKFSAFFMIENLGNLINDDWGVFNEQSFPHNLQLVEFTRNATTNQYNFNTFVTPAGQARVSDASLWEIRFGINYSF